MHNITANSFNELYVSLANKLIKNGSYIDPRQQSTLEICNVMLNLTDPKATTFNIPARKYNHDYLKAEFKWYKSGSYHIEDIKKHSSMWERIADDDGFINSNYGAIMFFEMNNGWTQWEWCKHKLEEDINTRQAVINFNQPKHKYDYNKDFVCTLNMQFLYRNDQLDCIVTMRSNDMIYGLAYDLPWFAYNQVKMAKELGVKVGNYYHYAASMHVYERHYDMLKAIAETPSTADITNKYASCLKISDNER